jgi:hypothetical protein
MLLYFLYSLRYWNCLACKLDLIDNRKWILPAFLLLVEKLDGKMKSWRLLEALELRRDEKASEEAQNSSFTASKLGELTDV